MSVNRSGYYKWLARKGKPNRYEQDRILLTKLLMEQHKKHKSKGYHYLANMVRKNTGWLFSDNLAHKCCKFAGIRSKTKRGYRASKGEESVKFPNKIKGKWTATRPLEIVVSDMTCIFHKGIRWEWTYILDTYNNEIIASSITRTQNSNIPYYKCLKQLVERVKEQPYPVILHTDQGSVYSSTGFYLAHKDYTTIERSMSRIGTPTDNPIIESINGWIKEELKHDFDLKNVKSFPEFIENYVYYFNNERLSCKLNYKTPVQFRIEQGFG